MCVSLCVACDFKVTDGTCHSFSARKPFTQEALLTGFVLMRRSTKRRSRYHSLIALTWLKPNSSPPLFSKSPLVASRSSISYIKYNKHTLMFAQRWTHILLLFLTLCLKHKHTHTYLLLQNHSVCGQILCEERVLTDVEAAVRSR